MNIDESTYELIERYLEDDLPPNERHAVEERMQSDQEFAKEVAWLKSLRADFQNPMAFEVLDLFQSIRARKRSIVRWQRAAVAALVVLLLLSVPIVFPLILDQTKEPDSLEPKGTEAVVEADPSSWRDLVAFPSDVQLLSNNEDELEQALNLIDQGKRKEALPLLENYLSQLPAGKEDFQNQLLAGMIYLYDVQDFPKAERIFDQVNDSDALPRYTAEARYYKALARSAQNDREGAIVILNDLRANAPAIWKEKAQTALEVISSQ